MTLSLLVHYLSEAFLLGGAFFGLLGGIGLLRMPDFFTRMHAASLTEIGTGLMLAGLMLKSGLTQDSAKLGMLLLLSVFANPTATHALARAGLLSGLKPQLGPRPSKNEVKPSKP